MFEQLDKPKKVAQVSIAMSLGILAAYLIGAFGGACLFIVLGGRRFGIQVASAIVYTYFVFWYVFFPTRGLLEKYSLRDKAVQRQIPLLLAIHCVFLISIVFGQTVWLGMKLRQSNRWITEHGTRGPGWVRVGDDRCSFLYSGLNLPENPEWQSQRRSKQIWFRFG